MIVFVLYLHVCSTQMTSMHGGRPAQPVTACSSQPTGVLYASEGLCDAAGKQALATNLTADTADTSRKVDAYACQSQTVAGK